MGKKVKFTSSMKFKIMAIVLFGMLFVTVINLIITIPLMKKDIKQVTQNYMLTQAQDYGYILDTTIAMSAGNVLENTNYMTSMLKDVGIRDMDSSYAYLVSADGTMLYHPTAEKIGQPVENAVVTKLVADLGQGIINEPACIEYDFKGVTKYAAYYIDKAGSYILVISADESDAFDHQSVGQHHGCNRCHRYDSVDGIQCNYSESHDFLYRCTDGNCGEDGKLGFDAQCAAGGVG